MSKLINVSDDVYTSLKRMKGNRSFSEVLRAVLVAKNAREKLLSFAEKFAGKEIVDKKAMKDMQKGWKKWAERYA